MDMQHGGNVWEGGCPERWLDFSANLRPEGPPAWVNDALHRAVAQARYYPDRDMRGAASGLAQYAGVPQACILPTAGGAAAIDLALSRQSGKVYLLPPTFGEYAQRAAAHGRAVERWTGVCGPGDTLVLCNPNNPTGALTPRGEVLALHRAVAARGAALVVDEAFIDHCPEHSVRADVAPGLMAVGSLTKALCIPGVRLGYLCAVPEEVEALRRQALPWALGALAAAVARELPEHLDGIQEDARRNRARRARLTGLLRGLGARVNPSAANFLLADFPRDMTLPAQRLKQRGVLVRTCASFGLGPRFLRLAVKTDEENLRLIRLLEEAMTCAESR